MGNAENVYLLFPLGRAEGKHRKYRLFWGMPKKGLESAFLCRAGVEASSEKAYNETLIARQSNGGNTVLTSIRVRVIRNTTKHTS